MRWHMLTLQMPVLTLKGCGCTIFTGFSSFVFLSPLASASPYIIINSDLQLNIRDFKSFAEQHQVVLKIIKHYQEEGQGTEVVQGVLLGLVVEDRLEITNCFPFPQHTEDDADFDEVQYQMEMMRSLRHVNIDHLHVGWYQSTYYGSFVTRALLDSQFSYQHAIEESVVLIYDPIKTAQGSLSLKAYRLTPKLMEVCKEKDFSPEALKKGNITFEHMFEEVPIVIKNSHLINVLMWELEKKSAVADKHELLSLASSNHLGKNLQLLMDRVDEMSQDIVKYNTYMRNTSKQQQQKHQVGVMEKFNRHGIHS
ncbi:eukaryotic translation initiation factor 3 subunit H isoform X2 [Panthera uncia]|uniref:eukaryotic translation initiation factor 3 subunit H isoform X2 n=1 Tax=Panthera uncia TaxID=29064 RepID=UPI0020FFEE08|nr:eukaryotic translation initiation factor 3 subunit H isoform X2 [Panthera uncia]